MNNKPARFLGTFILMLLLSPLALAQSAEDREAINELMWRYARALDTLDAEAYAAVYTEDGQFGSGDNAAKGHDALRQMIEDVRAGREARAAEGNPPAPMYHMTADSYIEFIDATHALHHSYWMTVFGAGEDSTPNIAAAGRGVDRLVKVNGQWLIQMRDVAPEN